MGNERFQRRSVARSRPLCDGIHIETRKVWISTSFATLLSGERHQEVDGSASLSGSPPSPRGGRWLRKRWASPQTGSSSWTGRRGCARTPGWRPSGCRDHGQEPQTRLAGRTGEHHQLGHRPAACNAGPNKVGLVCAVTTPGTSALPPERW